MKIIVTVRQSITLNFTITIITIIEYIHFVQNVHTVFSLLSHEYGCILKIFKGQMEVVEVCSIIIPLYTNSFVNRTEKLK